MADWTARSVNGRRQGVLVAYLEDALEKTRLTRESFALDLARIYCDRVDEADRSLDVEFPPHRS